MHYQISIPKIHPVHEAMATLQQQGLTHLYLIEESNRTIIGGFSSCKIVGVSYGTLQSLPEEVDWEAQWSQFASDEMYSIQLIPGCGFGDLSHPTTQLVCQLMQKTALGNSVVDLGCGSGVLGCVGVKCSVKQFYMVDIDLNALEHAKKNMKLNNAPCAVIYAQSVCNDWLPNVDTIMMNMILPHQYSVFEQCPSLHDFQGQWITSGLLKDHEREYLEFIRRPVTHRLEKDNWLAFVHS